MKLLNFHHNNILQLGIRTETGVKDVPQASEGYEGIPVTMDAAIRDAVKIQSGGQKLFAQFQYSSLSCQSGSTTGLPLELLDWVPV